MSAQFELLEFTYVVEHVDMLKGVVSPYPALYLGIVMTAALFVALVPRNNHEKKFVPGIGNAIGSVILLVWSIVSLSGLSTFLYFNF